MCTRTHVHTHTHIHIHIYIHIYVGALVVNASYKLLTALKVSSSYWILSSIVGSGESPYATRRTTVSCHPNYWIPTVAAITSLWPVQDAMSPYAHAYWRDLRMPIRVYVYAYRHLQVTPLATYSLP